MDKSTYLRGVLITFIGVLALSPDALLIRLTTADPWTLLIWRGLLSGVAVLTWVALTDGVGQITALARMSRFGWIVVMAFAANNLLFLYAATHTLIANTVFLASTSPVFAALIARFVLGETVGLRTWLTITATMVGVGVIASGSLGQGGGSIDGDLAAIGAAIGMATALSVARLRRNNSMVPPMGLAALISGIAGLFIAPTLLPPSGDWGWIAIMGLLILPLAFICITLGPRHIPAPDVGLILLAQALFAPLLVWWAIGENPGPRTLIGGAIVLGALALSNLVLLLRRQP